MSAERVEQSDARDPRVGRAIIELKQLILARWPDATFVVAPGEDDPGMTLLWATVDVVDTDEVTDAVIERVVELQVDERVPVAVIPVRPAERVLTEQRLPLQRSHRAASRARVMALASR